MKFKIYSLAFVVGAVFFMPTSSSAQANYDLKEMTPEVQLALDNRRDHFEQLKELKMQGIIGENNRGYVDLLKENPVAKALVEKENKDRRVIYSAIAEQNNLAGALRTIEGVFAQVQRDKAASGEKIQNENGEWTTK